MNTRQMLCLLALILLTFVGKIFLSFENTIDDSVITIQYFVVLCLSILIGSMWRLRV
jgi:hypothetical protein